ncbi:MAG: DNA topoisomerase I, partial [Gammaproteobacteria bacterium]|nr:DNA topoisomerase I [Gammaproteobacteria bacterium]
ITYMRTDSVTLANDAISEIRSLIESRYGKENLPDSPRTYKSKSKNAQEAHEAVRPTSVLRLPSELKDYMEPDQYRLYNLIWQRTVACQMVPAVFDTVKADLSPVGSENKDRFRANGSVLKKPGFMSVYKEDQDDKVEDDKDRILPEMTAGDTVKLLEVLPSQHFTEPPPRYTEASLVKSLEEHGIGRPSTYASIISTLRDREYVEMDGRRFIATSIGKIVAHFLTNHFERYVDYGFTAELEDELDEISRGEREWIPVLEQFWDPFIKQVQHKEETVTRDEAAMTRELGTDSKSGKPVKVKMGRYGPYVQIGSREDEEKPLFAGLRPGQNMDKITYDEAMKLFELPRDLGETPEGEPVSTNFGRFGPYVKYGSKYVSIKDDDPHTITLEKALELVVAKKKADAEKLIQAFPDAEIEVLNGRYGPYVTGRIGGKKINAKVPKDEEPKRLSLERCQQLLQERADAGPGWRRKKAGSKKKIAKKKAKKKTKKKITKKKGKKKVAKKTAKKKIAKKTSAKKKTTKKKVTKKKTTKNKAAES